MASTVYLPYDVDGGHVLGPVAGAYSTREKALDVAENWIRLEYAEMGRSDYRLYRSTNSVLSFVPKKSKDGKDSETLDKQWHIHKETIR